MASPRPEILAPAGSPEALAAALRAGADAVYFGLQAFNARARATNFELGELATTMASIHAAGARGYVTLNTLVFDHELPAMATTLRGCRDAGVDAVIVQDLGVATLAAAEVPDLPLHASTQMTCTDAASVIIAAALGARRVVLARELSIAEIATIAAASPVELEVFVHGALCVSYSGQCLTSEAIGGRSANRGACAQACRLPYGLLVDGEPRPLDDRHYLLSPQDLEASALVPALVDAGVRSFKIEGRLKGPDYVTAAVRLYRQALDGLDPAAARKQSLQVYSRGSGPGFLGGVDHQALVEARTCGHRGLWLGEITQVREHRGSSSFALRLAEPLRRGDGLTFAAPPEEADFGGAVWTLHRERDDVPQAQVGDDVWIWLGPDKFLGPQWVGRSVFKSKDVELHRNLERSAPHRRPLAMHVSGREGQPLVLDASDDLGRRARVETAARLLPAQQRPLDRDLLEAKLGRLGDTPYTLTALTCDLPGGLMIPVSALNDARRRLVDALRSARPEPRPRPFVSLAPPQVRPAPPPGGLWVLCRNPAQAHAALQAGADGVVLDFLELTGTGPCVRDLRATFDRPIGLCPPRIRKPGEEKIDRYLLSLAPDVWMVRTLGALQDLPPEPSCIGDFSLNVANHRTARVLLDRGLSAFTPAYDLDAAQLPDLLAAPELAARAEVVLHHPIPFFHMEHCLFAAHLSQGSDFRTCGRPCERHQLTLRDRTGALHPVEADVGCRNTVFRGAPQSAAELVPRLRKLGVQRYRLECVRESAAQVGALVEAYRELLRGAIEPAGLRQRLAQTDQKPVRGSLSVVAG